MKKNQRLEKPIITPSTKAEHGDHDEPISSEAIVEKGLVDKALWEQTCDVAMKLFEFGTEHARKQGLILVDTKYEFGYLPTADGGVELILADEIHTQDSSRYWMADSYEERFSKGEDPKMLDKEFVRKWLIEQGYMGDGTPPEFSDDFRVDIAMRYIEAYERITGEAFRAEPGNPRAEIEAILKELA
jgi:phosphoribosylaminoimidazole-succinocarboxamide synthase